MVTVGRLIPSRTDILFPSEWEKWQGGRRAGGRAGMFMAEFRRLQKLLSISPVFLFFSSPPSGLNICAFLFITGDSLPARYLLLPISLPLRHSHSIG